MHKLAAFTRKLNHNWLHVTGYISERGFSPPSRYWWLNTLIVTQWVTILSNNTAVQHNSVWLMLALLGCSLWPCPRCCGDESGSLTSAVLYRWSIRLTCCFQYVVVSIAGQQNEMLSVETEPRQISSLWHVWPCFRLKSFFIWYMC